MTLGLLACPAGEAGPIPDETVASAKAGGASGAPGAVARPAPRPRRPRIDKDKLPTFHVAVGPGLAIQRGKGVGPIRFGATIETIERLMGEPCEERRAGDDGRMTCRYSAQAVEFFLEHGVLEKVHVHGQGRVFRREPRLEFGIFNGQFVEGAALGMLRRGVVEFLGEPKRTERVEPSSTSRVVERHYYEGAILEYKRARSGRLVLDGVILER